MMYLVEIPAANTGRGPVSQTVAQNPTSFETTPNAVSLHTLVMLVAIPQSDSKPKTGQISYPFLPMC